MQINVKINFLYNFFLEDFSSQSGAEYKFKYIYLESHYFVMLSETLFLGQSFYCFF